MYLLFRHVSVKKKKKSRLEVPIVKRIEEKQPWRSLKYFSKPRVSPFIDASHCPIWLPIQVCFHNSNYDYWCMNQVAIWVRLWRQSKSTVNQNQEINSEIIAKSLFLGNHPYITYLSSFNGDRRGFTTSSRQMWKKSRLTK